MNQPTRKTTTIIFSITCLCVLVSACGQPQPSVPSAALIQQALTYLPVNTQTPQSWPAIIQDPQILAAWVYLYTHDQTIQIWDGKQVTTRNLAQLALDHHFVIEWSTPDNCQFSCTDRPICDEDHTCVDPSLMEYGIFLNPELRQSTDIVMIAGTLAHELFHHSEPFGKGKDTLFEEYWAFSIGSSITGDYLAALQTASVYQPHCLEQWFNGNSRREFYQMPVYPQAIAILEDDVQALCRYESSLAALP